MAEPDNGAKDPGEIRREIEETRANMSKTVSELETKLDPARIKAQVSSTVRENTIGRVEYFADNASETVKGAGTDVFDAIKKNPLPAAIAAIGLGWLFMESRNEGRQKPPRLADSGRNAPQYGYRYGYEYGEYPQQRGYQAGQGQQERGYQGGERRPMDRMREAGSNVGDKASQLAGSVRDTAGGVVSNVGEKAGDVASNVRDTAGEVASNVRDTAGEVASNVRDTAGDMASSVRDTAGDVAEMAQQQVYRARTRLETMMDETPLLVGVAAMALGAAIGMSLPATQKEDELLGNVRDNLMEKAQDTAKDKMDKVQAVAKEVTQVAQETAKSEAQKQNLTGGS